MRYEEIKDIQEVTVPVEQEGECLTVLSISCC